METTSAPPTNKQFTVTIRDTGNDQVPCGAIFTGRQLAGVSSKPVMRMIREASGQNDPLRWTELNLYLSDPGKYIAQRIYRTEHPEEYDVIEGNEFDTQQQVIDFFGGDRKADQSRLNDFDTVEKRAAIAGVHRDTQMKADKVAKENPELAKKV